MSNKRYPYRKRKYHQPYQNNEETESNKSSDDIPGFYYDPVKKKYFKIQSNSFGSQTVVTNDLVKNKTIDKEIKIKTQVQLKNRKNLINCLYSQELGVDHDLSIKYKDTRLINSKLKNLFSFEQNEKVKKIQLFGNKFASKNKFLLVNFVSIPHSYKVLKLNENIFEKNVNTEPLYTPIRILYIDRNREVLSESFENQTYLPSYVHNDSYFVSTFNSVSSTDPKPYKLIISELNYVEYNSFIDFIEYQIKGFKFPLWCSAINENVTKCAVGLQNSAEVCSLIDGFSCKLNTKKSDTFCVEFQPLVIFN